jgi:hypothetical protein
MKFKFVRSSPSFGSRYSPQEPDLIVNIKFPNEVLKLHVCMDFISKVLNKKVHKSLRNSMDYEPKRFKPIFMRNRIEEPFRMRH